MITYLLIKLNKQWLVWNSYKVTGEYTSKHQSQKDAQRLIAAGYEVILTDDPHKYDCYEFPNDFIVDETSRLA